MIYRLRQFSQERGLILGLRRKIHSPGVIRRSVPPLVAGDTEPTALPKPKLLDHVRQAIRAQHYGLRTEEAYVMWIKRFSIFHGKRHPLEMGEPEVNQFLTDLAVGKKVSASTQNQALSALLFLYRHVLNKPLLARRSIACYWPVVALLAWSKKRTALTVRHSASQWRRSSSSSPMKRSRTFAKR